MDIEFICLSKLGVGSIIIRYSDIITMELTPMGFTRIEFGYGEHLIVEETPIQILNKIRAAQEFSEFSTDTKTETTDKKE